VSSSYHTAFRSRAFSRKATRFELSQTFLDLPSREDYYATLFHELTHSTGHSSRLARKGITESSHFGSEKYSKEEMVAEMGAASCVA
jgi:antirestriction protein ArdC